MRIYECADYRAMSRQAANIISAQVILKPDCVLGLATGSTPVGAYRQLSQWNQEGQLSFREVRTVNLDEYKGLEPTHDQSYRYFMQVNFFDHLDILRENTHVPNGMAADADAECKRYDELIRSLGYADLQLLGIGHNGHIGFNEPGSAFVAPTHVVDLTERTIEANSRFFASADDVPRQAMTMGIGCIMAARRILMWSAARTRPRPSMTPSAAPSIPSAPPPSSSSTPTWSWWATRPRCTSWWKPGCLYADNRRQGL